MPVSERRNEKGEATGHLPEEKRIEGKERWEIPELERLSIDRTKGGAAAGTSEVLYYYAVYS